MNRPIRVLHFVTGGFSGGATQVAIKLVRAVMNDAAIESMLVLRRKRYTDTQRIVELKKSGLNVRVVPGWAHLVTIIELWKICREYRPDILVAHGFSEHLWGRYAGLLARVPALVHVEHNSRERYTWWRLTQARWLAKRTSRIVGCSEGVRQSLLKLGFPADRTTTIDNGVELEPFAQADAQPVLQREATIMMVARFGQQKDHVTLIRAMAELRKRGLTPQLKLAGGGKARHRKLAQNAVKELKLESQVEFLGLVRDVPAQLMRSRIAILSSRYEGMPLALIEGMAAGCVVIGTRVPGIQEIIDHRVNGLLTEPNDAVSLADALECALRNDDLADQMARTARQQAVTKYGLERMNADYAKLFHTLKLETGNAPGAR